MAESNVFRQESEPTSDSAVARGPESPGVAEEALAAHLEHAARLQQAYDTQARKVSSVDASKRSEEACARLVSGLSAEVANRVMGRTQAGVSFREAYSVGKVLGTGSSSVVCECRDRKSGAAYAVKLVRVTSGASCHEEEVRDPARCSRCPFGPSPTYASSEHARQLKVTGQVSKIWVA